MQLGLNNKLDTLVAMVAEQKKLVDTVLKYQGCIRKEISELRDVAQTFKPQLAEVPADKTTVMGKKRIPMDFSVCI